MRSRFVVPCVALLLVASTANAEDTDVTNVSSGPPMAPFKRGPLVEGSIGMYAPTGRLKNFSAPGPWMRLSAGYDFSRWIALFATGDCAFLSTNRAPPPPGERGYLLYGFGIGARLSIPAGERLRFPLRVEISGHKVDDAGVLSTYEFADARELSVSYGATIGLEWRAASRHFGVILEGGIRNDSGLNQRQGSDTPIAIVSALSLHYTL